MVVIGSGHPVTRKRIAELFAAIGLAPPVSYLDFLLAHNGGVPCPGDFSIAGLSGMESSEVEYFLSIDSPNEHSDLQRTFERLQSQLPDQFLPIASTACGSKLVVSCRSSDIGTVYYFDMQERDPNNLNAALFRVATSFEELLSFLG